MVFFGILASIVLFSCIVFIHEFGHFKLARIFKVKVEEFGLGIPPRAKKLFTDKTGTLFSLNWIPLGGFVRLKGEQNHTFFLYDEKEKLLSSEEIEKYIKEKKEIFDKNGNKIKQEEKQKIAWQLKENKDKDNLSNKPYWQQGLIILGGVGMNFIFAIIIFSCLFFFGVKPIGINDSIQTNLDIKLIPSFEQALKEGVIIKEDGIVLAPVEKSNAIKAGIKKGDILLAIEDKNVNSFDEVKNILTSFAGKEVSFKILRNKKKKFLKVNISKDGKIGAYMGENIHPNENFIYKYGFLKSIQFGIKETYNQSLLTLQALGVLVKNISSGEKEQREEALQSVSGPVGIVEIVGQSLNLGFSFFLLLGALISINLGVLNLLPIPALDGGRFLFICINMISEKFSKKKGIPLHIEGFIHILFFVLLIAFSIIITYNDISKLINK